MKVKALSIVAPGQVEVVEAVVEETRGSEVLIETKASGICWVELHQFRGHLPGPLPAFCGHEGAGIVRSVGERVVGFQPGDKVTALGAPSHAQYFKADAARVAKIPQEVEEFELWISEPATCATNGIRAARVSPGDTVVVLGCGYMGLLLIQGLPKNILANLIAIDIDRARLALAQQWGADIAWNPREVDVVKEMAAVTQGGADIVIEAAGGKGTIGLATQLVRRGGRLSVFAYHIGEETLPTGDWHMRGLEVQNPSPAYAGDRLRDFRDAVKLLYRGTYDQRPLITHRFPYTEAQHAFELASERPTDYIKGVILF